MTKRERERKNESIRPLEYASTALKRFFKLSSVY